MARSKSLTNNEVGLKYGFRSGLEKDVALSLEARGVPFTYEAEKIGYVIPATKHKYTPDFRILSNGIIVETKGRFLSDDRMKHRRVKEQHPDLDIRFVFTNPNARLDKKSKTTYAAWCEKYGFKYAKGDIPQEWLNEPPKTQEG